MTRKAILLIAVIELFSSNTSSGQNVEFSSASCFAGGIYSLKIINDMAFLGSYYNFRVLSLADATNPHYLGGCLLEDIALDLEVEWTPGRKYAYLIDNEFNSGVQIVDISDPTNPVLISRFEMWGFAKSLTYRYPYVYATSGAWGSPGGQMTGILYIIDVANPEAPREVGAYRWGNVGYSVGVQGDYAFVGCWTGLMIFDISDPADPRPIRGFGTGSAVRHMILEGNYAYLASYMAGLLILDISDPYEPLLVGEYDEETWELCKSDSLLYITPEYRAGIQILNVADPTNPGFVGKYWARENTMGIAVVDTLVYIGEDFSGLQAINISDPRTPKLLHIYPQIEDVQHLFVRDDYVYVAYSQYQGYRRVIGGMQIIDMSDARRPILLGKCQVDKSPHGIFVSGDYAYVCDHSAGLFIIDISDAGRPEAVSIVDSILPVEVITEGRYAYVHSPPDLVILDIADPRVPEIISTFHMESGFMGMVVSGGYIYLGGLYIVDISDPSDPTLVGNCFVPGEDVRNIALYQNYIYQTSWYGGIYIFDVSDPSAPYVAGNHPISLPWGICVQDNYLYFYDYHTGVHIMDISDPLNPTELEQYQTLTQCSDVQVSGDDIYTNSRLWLLALRWQPQVGGIESQSTKIEFGCGNYPNPFNSSTNIRFTIPEPSNIAVEIFNALGQRVDVLVEGYRPAGEFSVIWDASRVSTGSYFARLSADDLTRTLKMTVVK